MPIQQPMVGKVPTQTSISDKVGMGWRLVQTWLQWFTQLKNGLNSAALSLAIVSGTGAGSLGPLIFSTLPVLTEGLYRVSVTMQVTRPGTVSSSLAPTLSYTSSIAGVAQAASITGAAMTSNDPSLPVSETFLLAVRSATTISYSFAYASVGIVTMQYQYSWVIEQVPGPAA